MVAVAPIWRDHHAGILQSMVHPAHRVKRHCVKFTNSQEARESYLGQFVSEVIFYLISLIQLLGRIFLYLFSRSCVQLLIQLSLGY